MPNDGKSSRKHMWIAGIGVVAAALIVYFSLYWPPVPKDQVQGAVGSRDVHRQAQMSDKDVGVAGKAKVTVDDLKKLVASPQFKEMASNANFQLLVGSHQLAQLGNVSNAFNQSMGAILQNPAYNGLFQNPQFHQMINSNAFHGILLNSKQLDVAQVTAIANQFGLNGQAANITQLVNNAAVHQLFSNPGFNQLFSNPNFASLVNNAQAMQLFAMPGVIELAALPAVENLANVGQLNTLITNSAMQTQLFSTAGIIY